MTMTMTLTMTMTMMMTILILLTPAPIFFYLDDDLNSPCTFLANIYIVLFYIFDIFTLPDIIIVIIIIMILRSGGQSMERW